MRRRQCRAGSMSHGLVAACCALTLAAATHARLPPLAVSPDGRQLLKGDQPFFWLGDTAWDLVRLSPAELDQYFANRRAKGFNVIQGPLLHTSVFNHAGVANPNAHAANGAWWAHIDYIISRAAAHGLYIAPVLTSGVFAGQFNQTSAFTYGQFIGERYRDAGNVAAYIVAAEFNYPQDNTEIWDAMAQGLLAGSQPQVPLLTAHPRWFGVSGGQSSSHSLHDFAWLSFNMLQSSLYGDCTNDPSHLYYLGTHNWMLIEDDWQRRPTKPVLDGEATYEQQSPVNPTCQMNPQRWPAFGVRRRAYWSVFAGGFGHTYGANGVFQFNLSHNPTEEWDPLDFWDVAVDYPGAAQMAHLRRLMQSRPIPGRRGANDLLLAGGTIAVPGHLQATIGRNAAGVSGAFAMVYVPKNNKAFTIDMDLLSGDAHRLWWFIPATGQATLIGEHVRADYAPDGGLGLTTPAVGEDFVLVVDDIAAGFAAPGAGHLWLPGDANGDEHVNVADLLTVINAWGPCPAIPAPCLADVAPPGALDREVNVIDLLAVINNWGA